MPPVPTLAVHNLWISYATEGGRLDAVRDVSLAIDAGRRYGLVGESGSGKTTLALGVLRFLPGNGSIRGGRVLLEGEDLMGKTEAEMRTVWGGRIAMVYQNPVAALNPALRVGEQVAEVARVHLGLPGRAARDRANEMLALVRMPDPAAIARRFPHELSGGMAQRAVIAMALAGNPRLLILDEPTTALDVTTEAAVLDLILDLTGRYAASILYITHNLGVVARVCDRVGVLYAGELLEEGDVGAVFRHPLHPYTRGLLACVPQANADKRQRPLSTIPGRIPRPNERPVGCIFAPRCYLVEDACRVAQPPLIEAEPGHLTACRRWPVTAHVGPPAPSPTQDQGWGDMPVLLEALDVRKYFSPGGWAVPWHRPRPVKAVDGISATVPRSLTVGLVGESGSGKTTFGRCLVGLLEPTSGEVTLEGRRLAASVVDRPLDTIKRLQMVFQNPDASLNPRLSVGEIVGRPLVRLQRVAPGDVPARVAELLASVNLPPDYAQRLPEELSGGEKQRVAIARAFAAEPDLLVADEPVSSLDVSVQGALLNLLASLQTEKGTAYLFISHDLAAVRYLSDFIAVVYLGRVWEIGQTAEVFAPPFHPYTEALLSAIPVVDPDVVLPQIRLEGQVPSPAAPPPGCTFHTRCPRKLGEICERELPPWRDVSPTHRICCHRELEDLRQLQVRALAEARARTEKGG